MVKLSTCIWEGAALSQESRQRSRSQDREEVGTEEMISYCDNSDVFSVWYSVFTHCTGTEHRMAPARTEGRKESLEQVSGS